MTSSKQTCLIQQSDCGLTAEDPVCSKCGLDTRVRYVNEESALLVKEGAQAKYQKAFVENIRQVEGSSKPADKSEQGGLLSHEPKTTQNEFDEWQTRLATIKIGSANGVLSMDDYRRRLIEDFQLSFFAAFKNRVDVVANKKPILFVVFILFIWLVYLLKIQADGVVPLTIGRAFGALFMAWVSILFAWFLFVALWVLYCMKSFFVERSEFIELGYAQYLINCR